MAVAAMVKSEAGGIAPASPQFGQMFEQMCTYVGVKTTDERGTKLNETLGRGMVNIDNDTRLKLMAYGVQMARVTRNYEDLLGMFEASLSGNDGRTSPEVAGMAASRVAAATVKIAEDAPKKNEPKGGWIGEEAPQRQSVFGGRDAVAAAKRLMAIPVVSEVFGAPTVSLNAVENFITLETDGKLKNELAKAVSNRISELVEMLEAGRAKDMSTAQILLAARNIELKAQLKGAKKSEGVKDQLKNASGVLGERMHELEAKLVEPGHVQTRAEVVEADLLSTASMAIARAGIAVSA